MCPDAYGNRTGQRKCRVDGCERDGRAGRDLCKRHYHRWAKYGDPLGGRDERPDIPFDIPETTAAYLAGLFDGEGSIYCAMLDRRAGHGGISMGQVITRVVISNTVREVLDWARLVLGAGAVKGYPRKSPRHRICYDLVLGGVTGERFIRTVLPYLKIKQERAALMLKFRATVRRNGPIRVAADVVEARREILALLPHMRRSAEEES